MTTVQGVAFGVLLVMVLIWFYSVNSLKRQLLQRHPDTHEELELSRLWSGMTSRHDNSRPALAMLRFLLRKEYLGLHDRGITSLSVFMRWLFVVYLALFGYLSISILRQGPEDDDRENMAAAVVAPEDPSREAAFDLHRAQKWQQAIGAYDAIMKAGGEDAEILYWRGMAHWKSARFDEALRDFRRVIDLDPTNLDAHRHADHLLARQKRWDDILAMWNWYISRQPPNAEAYFERGGTYFQKGDMVSARADAAKACELGKAQACKMLERLKDR